MIFDTLKDKCEYYRKLTDYRLLPNGYTLVMIDGKNFSKLVKNKFEKPFDNVFIRMMDDTAKHLCENIQNCIGAYVQSDEISLIIKDHSETCMPFDGRMCKLLSIIPSLATSYFTKEMIKYYYFIRSESKNVYDIIDQFTSDYVFDCKVWNVPNDNDAFAWFLYRQIDCVRNSKQQFCQTYIPHKQLENKNTDEQVALCKELTKRDWNFISDNQKFGRFLYKDTVTKLNDKGEEYTRKIWSIMSLDLTDPDNREKLKEKWEIN